MASYHKDFYLEASSSSDSSKLRPLLHQLTPLRNKNKKLSRTLSRGANNSKALSRSTSSSLQRSTSGLGQSPKYAQSCEELVSLIAKGNPIVCGPRLGLRACDSEAIASVLRDPIYNRSIRHLDLHSNDLGSAGVRQLVNALSTDSPAPNLAHLCLHDNKMDETAGKALASLIKLDPPLETIILSRNQLGQTGGHAIVDALKVNTKIRQLDLSDNQIDAKVGLEFAEMLLYSLVRKIDISGNDFPSDVDACIQAAVTFSKATWSGTHSFTEAVREARNLNNVFMSNAPDMRAYLEAVARYWPDEASLTDFMAALHAPIAIGRHNFAGDSQCGNFEYQQDKIQFLASLYIPHAAHRLQLPGGHISVRGIFVLNLTPFSLTLEDTGMPPYTGYLMPESHFSEMDSDVLIELSRPADADEFVPNVEETLRVARTVGERRYKLSCIAEEGSGELRAMCSMKDLPSIGLYKTRIATMITLVWAPPPHLCGVELAELKKRWNEYSRQQLASRTAVSPDANMYQAVESWIKPDTAPTQSNFASLCKFGPVNTFVSHWWGSPLRHTIQALECHCNGDEAQRVWICSLANNQWRVASELGDDLNTSPFRQALGHRTCTSMALMLDADGAPLKRFWCLFEIMTVIILRNEGHAMEFDLCTPQGVINRGQIPVDDGLRITRLIGDISVEHAQCSQAKDRQMIEREIKENLGGFKNMDDQIRTLAEEGLRTLHEKQLSTFRETHGKLGLNRTFSDVFDELSPVGRSGGGNSCSHSSDGANVSFTKAYLLAELDSMRAQVAELSAENQRLKRENTTLKQDKATQRWLTAHDRHKARNRR